MTLLEEGCGEGRGQAHEDDETAGHQFSEERAGADVVGQKTVVVVCVPIARHHAYLE